MMQHKISLMTICKTIKQFTFQFYAPAVLTVLSLLFLGASSILDCEQSLPLQSVKSKLGRTGESELAERETGERREEEGLHLRLHSFNHSLL